MNEPIRIAQIMGKWLGGGVEAVIMNYYRHIDRSKIQFDFICDSDSTDIPYEEIEKLGGRVILVPPYQKLPKYIKELKKIFKENNYKIVHSNLNALSVFPLYAAKKAKVPIRIAHNHSTTNKKEWKKNILKQVLRPFSKIYATNYMACSEHAGRWMFGNKEFEKNNVFILNNAIDIEKFKYNKDVRNELRNELDIDENTIVIGNVGRFTYSKNQLFIIDIFYKFHKENKNSKLLFIGQGSMIDAINNKIKELKLENDVIILSQKKDIYRYYNVMDAFLFPSLYEGLGMVAIEAQVNGLPCIASSEVPKITKISDRIDYIDLSENDEYWAKTLIESLRDRKSIKYNENYNLYNVDFEKDKLTNYYENIFSKMFSNNENQKTGALRILQLGMTDNLGGIETYLINYYRNIDKNKIQFDFVNIYKNPLCFSNEIYKLGGKIYYVSSYYKHPFKYIRQVKKIINDNNYNIIHCNMNSAVMLYPLIAAKLSKSKIVIAHSHNSSSDKGFLKELLHQINKHFIPLFANKYFACSDYAGKWFFSKKILNSDNYYVINNAVEIEKYKYNSEFRKEIRKELKISDDEIVIGHVGRFNKQKNHQKIIEIFEKCLKKNKKMKLILVGIGPLKEEIEKMVVDKKINDKVIFLGQRNDVDKLYQAFDIFILPSLYEGLPLVGVEAQTSGCFCIFSDSITKEVKVSDKSIFLSIDKTEEWVNKMINYKIKNRKTVFAEDFDIDINSKKIVEIYYKMIRMGGKYER